MIAASLAYQFGLEWGAVRSLLMDRETLLVHRDHWGEAPEPTRRELSRLSNEESELYDELRSDRLQVRLRLEQERVSFGWLLRRLGASAGIR